MTELSREAILAMVPGRELNKLVAEKLMGWTLTDVHETVYDMEGRIEGGTLWRDDDGDAVFLRDYSTDISAAFEIVEKFKGTEHKIFLDIHPAPKGYRVMAMTFSEMLEEHSALTASEAICKAALLTTLKEEI